MWTASNPSGDVVKIGRNQSCSCGSGRKFKRCCGSGPPLASLAEAQRLNVRKRSAFEANFGKVRGTVHTDFQGRKVVAVGSQLVMSSKERPWRTFPDFAVDYLRMTMGRSWWTAEGCKDETTRHPLLSLAILSDRVQGFGGREQPRS